jgi:Uma2 family endonuclease
VYCEGADLLLTVEVMSPSSRAYDKALKMQLYGDAGVPFFLLVDPATTPVSATCFELAGDSYQEIAQAGDGTLALTRPFGVTVYLG